MNSFLHIYTQRDEWIRSHQSDYMMECMKLINQGMGKKIAKKRVKQALWRILRNAGAYAS